MHWISVLPPLVTLVAVILTRRVILSLAAGVLVGSFAITGPRVDGLLLASEYLAGAVAERGNAFTLMFIALFGALAEVVKVSGGVAGFTDAARRQVRSERGLLLTAWLILPFTFFDNVFRTLSVGSVLEPLIDKVKGSRDKLAFVMAATTAQTIVLIPLATAYAGYMVGLVRANMPDVSVGATSPGAVFSLFLRSVYWNLYSISFVVIGLGVTLFGLGYGRLRIRALSGEEEFTPVHEERNKLLEKLPPEYPAKLINLIVPVGVLLLSTLFLFWWTGRGKAGMAGAAASGGGLLGSVTAALGAADFTTSIMAATLLALVVAIPLYWFQKVSFTELETHLVEGSQNVIPLLAILVLSWALSRNVRDLGFDTLVSSVLVGSVPRWAVPAAAFLVGGAISYVIGSSFATWALIMPLAAGLSRAHGVDLALTFGAVWAGGSVGDSASPLSDLPVLVSGVMKIPVARYASAALPYALVAAAVATTGFLLAAR